MAEAMPTANYGFKPHPESITFGEPMVHIASTHYQFCVGLKDTNRPAIGCRPTKDVIVQMLSDSFDYCAAVIPSTTEAQ